MKRIKDILSTLRDTIADKTWRLRHIWSHGHIPFGVTLDYQKFKCYSCWIRREDYNEPRRIKE